LPHLIAPRGAQRSAPAPRRSARSADCSRPYYPLTGALPLANASVGIGGRVTLPALGAGLPSCSRYTRGSLRAPAGQPSLAASDGRRADQAGMARAERGAGVRWRAAWRQRAPTPLVRRCAPKVGRAVFHWPGCVPRIGTPWKASHGRGSLTGGRSSGAAGQGSVEQLLAHPLLRHRGHGKPSHPCVSLQHTALRKTPWKNTVSFGLSRFAREGDHHEAHRRW
jgi:hypothetical protein